MSEVFAKGVVTLRDPNPVAEEAPYTFMPSPEIRSAVAPGNLVKAIFSDPEGEYSAERMWACVLSLADDILVCRLDNEPHAMPNLKAGDTVTIPRSFIIDVLPHEGPDLPAAGERKEYWDRCFVDDCIRQGRSRVDYLYREEADMTEEGNEYPDSGWRIRGTEEACSTDAANERHPQYVALGTVLNADDNWLHLIDSEVGSAFAWNPATSTYFPVVRQ